MKKKHSFQEYFNAIGVHAVANPTPLNNALWGLTRHCEMELLKNKHGDSIERVGSRMDAWQIKTSLYNLFEECVVLKPAEISSNKKIKMLRVDKIDIPQEKAKHLIDLYASIQKDKERDSQFQQREK